MTTCGDDAFKAAFPSDPNDIFRALNSSIQFDQVIVQLSQHLSNLSRIRCHDRVLEQMAAQIDNPPCVPEGIPAHDEEAVHPEKAFEEENLDEDPEFRYDEQRKISHRIDRRLIGVLGFLHMVSLMDRGNIGAAAIAGMKQGLDLIGFRYVSLSKLLCGQSQLIPLIRVSLHFVSFQHTLLARYSAQF
jgi:hypothetical protein